MKEGWNSRPLGELCDIELGATPPRANKRFWDQKKETNNIWLSIADLPKSFHARISSSAEYLSNEGAKRVRTVKSGTLLVSFKLTLGRLAYAGVDLRTNEAIAALTILDDSLLNQSYLYWFLTFFDWQKAAEGSDKVKGKTLNKAKLKELTVPVPALPEQRCIVAVLDEAFKGLATATANAEKNLKNARRLFEDYRDTIFQQGRDGWIETPLDDLIEIKHGFAFESAHFKAAGKYVLLTPGNFFEEGGYRDRGDKQKYYVGDIPDGYILNRDDFLIAMTEQAAGLLGSSVIVPEDNKFLHNQRLGLVRLKPGAVWTNKFFFHAFNAKQFRKDVHESASGVKVRHTSPNKLLAIRVSYPTSRQKQIAIASDLDDLAAETARLEENYRSRLGRLSKLKQSILRKAFSGELSSPPLSAIKEAAE